MQHLRLISLFFTTIFGIVTLPVSGIEPLLPLPQNIDVDPDKASLGKKLFLDPRLSLDDSISCNSCHLLATAYGADNKKVSKGIGGAMGSRNSPTVYNAALNFSQFWDGRSQSLAEQAAEPVINPVEMGMLSWDDLVVKLSKIQNYQQSFQNVYKRDINQTDITDAIAEFEKTLITINSPFDQFLRGDEDAITPNQKKGYSLFKSYGCTACHQGQNVGGNLFQKLGVLKDINLQDGNLSEDLGRYMITRNEWDKRVFKVPSLRLAVKTAPYFHNGSAATIEEAVDVMIKFQLGRQVPANDKAAIIDFLGTLVGELPKGIVN